jgi:hypothetical protein
VEDGRHSGVADVSVDTVTSTFVIYNVGHSPLQLTGNPPVQFNGAASTDFVVVTQPATTILPGESSTFAIRFDPTLTGNRRVEVRFPTNDPIQPTFTFEILGIGQASATVLANNDSNSMPEDTIMSTGFLSVVPKRAQWTYFEDILRTGPTAVYPNDATPGDTWSTKTVSTFCRSDCDTRGERYLAVLAITRRVAAFACRSSFRAAITVSSAGCRQTSVNHSSSSDHCASIRGVSLSEPASTSPIRGNATCVAHRLSQYRKTGGESTAVDCDRASASAAFIARRWI